MLVEVKSRPSAWVRSYPPNLCHPISIFLLTERMKGGHMVQRSIIFLFLFFTDLRKRVFRFSFILELPDKNMKHTLRGTPITYTSCRPYLSKDLRSPPQSQAQSSPPPLEPQRKWPYGDPIFWDLASPLSPHHFEKSSYAPDCPLFCIHQVCHRKPLFITWPMTSSPCLFLRFRSTAR